MFPNSLIGSIIDSKNCLLYPSFIQCIGGGFQSSTHRAAQQVKQVLVGGTVTMMELSGYNTEDQITGDW